ncbi:MAG: cupin domain-containing protein [Burkholderiaceae bacterium]
MNLFSPLPDVSSGECIDALFERPGCRVERIVSWGQSSPAGFWYEQDWDEWVLILAGGAVLTMETRPKPVSLACGDYLMIPAGVRHRVESTETETPTIWLAIHFAK